MIVVFVIIKSRGHKNKYETNRVRNDITHLGGREKLEENFTAVLYYTKIMKDLPLTYFCFDHKLPLGIHGLCGFVNGHFLSCLLGIMILCGNDKLTKRQAGKQTKVNEARKTKV